LLGAGGLGRTLVPTSLSLFVDITATLCQGLEAVVVHYMDALRADRDRAVTAARAATDQGLGKRTDGLDLEQRQIRS
jgi:hypothetical protein